MIAARLWPLALCLGLVGCSHYQLGTQGKLSFSSLFVEPVVLRTLLPQSQAILSTQIRQAFLQNGRVELVDSPQAADATLSVVITDYHRQIAATLEQDTGLASKFTLTLGVTATLRDNRSGQTLIDHRKLEVQMGSYTDNGNPDAPAPNDQLQSEYNTLPLLAAQMAGKISHLVLDVW